MIDGPVAARPAATSRSTASARWAEVLVADDLAELALGFEHPGGGPAQAHVAGLPALEVAAGGAADADRRLDRVRRGQRLVQLGMDPQALQRDRLGQALAQRRRGARVRVGQLAGERLQALDRGLVVGELPGGAQPPLDRGPVTFGEVIEDVAFSLKSSSLSRGAVRWAPSCVRGAVGKGSVLFRRWLRTPCRSELSRLLNSLWAVQSARTQLEFAGTGVVAPRGREGAKGCCSARTCQLAMRTLRATAALAGWPLPPQRSLTSP